MLSGIIQVERTTKAKARTDLVNDSLVNAFNPTQLGFSNIRLQTDGCLPHWIGKKFIKRDSSG